MLRNNQVGIDNKITALSDSFSVRLKSREDHYHASDSKCQVLERELTNVKQSVGSVTTSLASLQSEVNGLLVTSRSGSGLTPAAPSSSGSANSSAAVAASAPASLSLIATEIRDRESRRCNIVISGLQPSVSITDEALVNSIFNELHHVTLRISASRRLRSKSGSSRPQLLHITLQNANDQLTVLRVAKNLRHSQNPALADVYINPDRTRTEIEEQRQLNNERRTRIAAGEDVIIRGGKVIRRPHQP